MNLYLISQDDNLSPSAYRRAVVAAETPDDARMIHPGGDFFNTNTWWQGDHHSSRTEVDRSGFWVKPEYVQVSLLGGTVDDEDLGARPAGVVCARTAEAHELVETFEART